MNILIIAAHDRFKNWQSKNYLDILIAYHKNSKNNVWINFTDKNINIQQVKNFQPHLIVFLDIDRLRFGNKFRFLFNMGIPIAGGSMDLFQLNLVKKCQYYQKANSIFLFYKSENLIKSYEENFKNKFITNLKSRFVNLDRFKDWKQKKIYDVVLFGSRNTNTPKQPTINDTIFYKYNPKANLNFYPMRSRLENILLQMNKAGVIRAKILNATGSKTSQYNNEQLSKIINQSWLGIATSSRTNILMDKYLEIAASKTVILGNIPIDYRNYFEGNMVEVNMQMSNVEICEKIVDALLDKKELQRKMDKMYEIVRKEFGLDSAVMDYDKVFGEIYNKCKK
jgi:hypothetical protein